MGRTGFRPPSGGLARTCHVNAWLNLAHPAEAPTAVVHHIEEAASRGRAGRTARAASFFPEDACGGQVPPEVFDSCGRCFAPWSSRSS
jgi:hypothetical protein